MLSLGIDPGTAIVGYGLVREHEDGALEAIHYGVIRTPAHTPAYERLETIFEAITQIIRQYKPDRAGIEELFFGRNTTTAISVAQGRGVLLLALQQARLPIAEYKPSQVKQSIAGYGAADKQQMQRMIQTLLGLEDIPKPDDAADALGVAITDLHYSRFSGYELL